VKFKVYSASTPKPKVVNLKPRRILLVEDEQDLAELVALHLGDLCDEVVVANDGHEGMRLATSQDWALLVLDLRLPGPDGLEICRAVRRERSYQPILMLTSKSSELDRVLGLELGADDYIVKPYGLRELLARVRAVLRRVAAQAVSRPAEAPYRRFDGWVLNRRRRRLINPDGVEVVLGKREYALLAAFLDAPQRPLSREYLLQVTRVHDDVFDRCIDVQILRLRRKIERRPSDPKLILTERGVGYVFAAAVESTSH